jgi:hypothetical protein
MNKFSPLRSFVIKRPHILQCRRYLIEDRKPCDPLRILFCGADEFSIRSLEAVHHAQQSKPGAKIQSIDVVCRQGKRTGRGLKTVRNGMKSTISSTCMS